MIEPSERQLWHPKEDGTVTQMEIPTPTAEWFNKMKTKEFESEKEVEYYFIMPMLKELGYDESDIRIGYSIPISQRTNKALMADFVLFEWPSRNKSDILLVIEAKKFINGISDDHIQQLKIYAHELLPPYYLITDGQRIIVFRFNYMKFQDERVLDFDRTNLNEKWNDLYKHTSKNATTKQNDLRDSYIQKWRIYNPVLAHLTTEEIIRLNK